MNFSSMASGFSEYISDVSVVLLLLPLFAVLAVYLISRENFWKVSKIAFLLVVIMTVYEIAIKTQGDNLYIKFKTYFSNTNNSYDFFYLFLPIFMYSLVISFLFSIIDKIRSKIEVKMNKLPR